MHGATTSLRAIKFISLGLIVLFIGLIFPAVVNLVAIYSKAAVMRLSYFCDVRPASNVPFFRRPCASSLEISLVHDAGSE